MQRHRHQTTRQVCPRSAAAPGYPAGTAASGRLHLIRPTGRIETSAQRHLNDVAIINSAYQTRAHRIWSTTRQRVIDSLMDEAGPDPHLLTEDPNRWLTLAAKLESCCRYAQVVELEDGTVTIAEQRCRSRLCPRCAHLRSREMIGRAAVAIRAMNSPRLITLTLKSSDDPLADQIARLTTDFKKLRRSETWKAHVVGGLYVIEVTYNERSQQWHPHMHVVADGKYWPQSSLADQWHRITGDSRIVDIRHVYDARDAAAYVAAYVQKSSDIDRLPSDRIPEWAASVHGLRMSQTFGSLHGVKLTPERETETLQVADTWSAEWIADLTLKGHTDAAQILDALLQRNTNLPTRLSPKPSGGDESRRYQVVSLLRSLKASAGATTRDLRTPDRTHPPPDHRARDGTERLWQEPTHPTPARTF